MKKIFEQKIETVLNYEILVNALRKNKPTDVFEFIFSKLEGLDFIDENEKVSEAFAAFSRVVIDFWVPGENEHIKFLDGCGPHETRRATWI